MGAVQCTCIFIIFSGYIFTDSLLSRKHMQICTHGYIQNPLKMINMIYITSSSGKYVFVPSGMQLYLPSAEYNYIPSGNIYIFTLWSKLCIFHMYTCTHIYTYTQHTYTHLHTCIYNIHNMHTCLCKIGTYMHTYTTYTTCIHTHTYATYPICINNILETRDIETRDQRQRHTQTQSHRQIQSPRHRHTQTQTQSLLDLVT